MPFCSGCGSQVSQQDVYCRNCGGRQPAPETPSAGEGISPRTASLLCYIPFVGWIAAIAVLAAERFRDDRTVRFHAFQGLYLFVAWLIVQWVISPLPFFHWGRGFRLDRFLELGLVGVSVFMMVKVGQGRTFSLPIVGELAEKSVAGN
ncbi:MAG: hypothetical protein FJW34_12315 [Acidobacteria bacterium]|nr:hypothetical protein [Acidobacteriota bacterium]